MKRGFIGLLIGLVLAGVTGTAAAADATAAVDVVSAYVWRGITFNDGVVVQPSIDVAGNGFGLNVWGNLDVDDYDDSLDEGEFSEVDVTLRYGFETTPADVTVGYIEYLFPNGGKGTREVFLSVSKNLFAGIRTGIAGYYDVDEVDDVYLNVSAAYAHEFDSGLSIGLGALAGYAGQDMSAGDDGGVNEYTLTIDAGYALNDAFSMGAFVAYTGSLDTDVLPDQDVDIYGGVSIASSF